MYEIRFLDSMTGKVIAVRGETLSETLEALEKAKAELYYSGASNAEMDRKVPENLYEDRKPSSEDMPQTTESTPDRPSDYPMDGTTVDDDYAYMGGYYFQQSDYD